MKNIYLTLFISLIPFTTFAQSPGFSNPLPHKMNQEFVDKYNAPTSTPQEFGLQKNCVIQKKECELSDVSTCSRLSCDEPFAQSPQLKINSTNTLSPSGKTQSNFPGMGSNPDMGDSALSPDNIKKNKTILDEFIKKNNLIGMPIVNFNSQYKNNLPKELNDFTIRVLPFNSMATMDYSPQRININLDKDNTIKSMTIG